MVKIIKNEWHPDTCGCKFEYEFDADLQKPVTNWTRNVEGCPTHSGLSGKDVFDSVLGENQSKNIALEETKKSLPDMEEEYTDPQTGRLEKRFKPGKSIGYEFDGNDHNRKLLIKIEGKTLSSAEKKVIDDKIRDKLGNDKVKIK
jgi:hypothetical protein